MACWKFLSTPSHADTGLPSGICGKKKKKKMSVFSYHQTLQIIRHNTASEQQAIERWKCEVFSFFFLPQN